MSLKRKKQVRCTMCNQFSWMGNKDGKIRPRDKRQGITKKYKNKYLEE